MSQRRLFIAYGLWLSGSLAVPMAKEGLGSPNSLTRLGILASFALSLGWYAWRGKRMEVTRPRRVFIVGCVLGAMVGETFYMVSRPLHPSLLISAATPLPQALRNLLVDLALTLPAYLLIFSVIWHLATHARYSTFGYFFVMALGQALGDGNVFFVANPGALLFVPYVMLN